MKRMMSLYKIKACAVFIYSIFLFSCNGGGVTGNDIFFPKIPEPSPEYKRDLLAIVVF